MRITALIAVSVTFGLWSGGGLRAQEGAWQQIYDRPSNIIREIEMFDDEYGLALTGPGILRTEDGGETWDEPAGHPLIATGQIAFASREVAWVVTWSGGIWRTEDAGLTLSQQASNTQVHLNSVAVIDEDEAWIAGAGEGFSDVALPVAGPSLLLHTRNGGTTWRAATVAGFRTFHEVAWVDGRLWLVATRCMPGDATSPGFPGPEATPCDSRRTLLRSDDGGDSWDELTNADVPESMQFLDRNHGIGTVSSCTDAGACGSVLVVTTDGGETWARRSEPLATFVPELRFVDVDDGWSSAVGECDDTGINCARILLATTDGGLTWRESHRISQSYAGGLSSAFDVTTKHIVIADGETGIARAPIGGGSFVQAETPARPGVRPVFVSRDVGFSRNYPGLRKTVDGGVTWSEVVGPEPLGETAITAAALWSSPYCGVICTNYVYRSVDGGASWERRAFPPGVEAYLVQAVDADHAWAQGVDAIWRTTDGGVSWVAINADFTRLQPRFVTANFGFARSCAAPPCDAKFTVTHDGGMTIEERMLPNDRTDLGVFIDASTGWASSYESNADGSVYLTRFWRTRDGARTWEDMGVASTQISLSNALFIDADRGWSIGYPPYDSEGNALGSQQIVATTDGGRTWTPEYTLEQTIFGGAGGFSAAGDRLWVTSGITDNPWSIGRTVVYRRDGIEREPVVPPLPPVDEIITPPDTGNGGYR